MRASHSRSEPGQIRGLRFEVKSLENRRVGRMRVKRLKRRHFPGLESGWNVAGIRLATF